MSAEIEEKLESMEIQDDELVFDLTMKKKKKKSKKVDEEPAAEEAAAETQEQAPAADAEEDPMAMFGEKKKKKKKVKVEDDATAEGGEEGAAADAGESFDFGDMKKKKKKSKKVDFSAFEDGQDQEGEDGARDPDDIFAADDEEGAARSAGKAGGAEAEEGWIGSNRDYTYAELLSRVFKILRQNNPELAGEKKRYTIVPPSVMRDGNKKTVFANVADICKRMHRQPEHVIQFLFAELGTSGSIDGSQRLVIKGRFQQKQIEAVLRRYIVEYVTCKTCKSPDTILTKENRLFFLQCEACGSTRSVSAIKSGFQAQTGKRAAQRVKAAAPTPFLTLDSIRPTMSSTDAVAATTTHKRKASSPEASSLTSPTKEHGSGRDSKKARSQAHADDCEDADCDGCAEGEIVLQFDTQPSAVELFQMAREEVSKSSLSSSGSGSGLSRMAKALFDKAIEEFEVLEKANAHIELNDGSQVAAQVRETKMQHAACVVAVGNAIPSIEMLQEGGRMFDELVGKTAAQGDGNALVGLAIAEVSQAKDLRRQAMRTLIPEDEDDDEEPSEEARDAATLVGKSEEKLVRQALDHFTKGLQLLKDKSASSFAQESIRATQELEEYGVSLDLKANSDLAKAIFNQAIRHLEDAQKSQPESVDSNADVLTIYGSCLYSKARLVTTQSQGDLNPATTFVEKAIEVLVRAEDMQDDQGDAKTLEALGQACLMSTGLIEDEDVVMDRFDTATEKLSRALELDPDNEALREQVEALQGGENDDDEVDYQDEDEDAEDGEGHWDDEEEEEEEEEA
ncbi:hypothetical protein BGZ99_002958 [Dissophora globulifera]|uniref:Translation initiation factor IF2/IF5 domain-containing protein n=1 Tax=Dissophora globulifera TaxID=979702 RepID=A0A9P6RLT2_9FUNG|nr:hypothetical protein BGZ99_002958 [Dissophora globulifera]